MATQPPHGWHKHPVVAEAIHNFHALGKPVGGSLTPAPWGGAIHVFTEQGAGLGSFLRNAGRTAFRWLAPKAAAAARAAAPIAGEIARDAARSALTGEGSLAERLRQAQAGATESARQAALTQLR